jgi:hypothetical protein
MSSRPGESFVLVAAIICSDQSNDARPGVPPDRTGETPVLHRDYAILL